MSLSKLVFVAALIAFGVWFFFSRPAGNGNATPDAGGASGASEASLDADLSALDAQLQALEQASAAVDASFSDAPVEQTE